METVAKKCNDCKNLSICKFVDEMEKVQIGVYAIDKSTKSPINIDITCISYERRLNNKQDGIVYR